MHAGAAGGQDRALVYLELDLQLVVNHHVGAGDQMWSFKRVVSVLRN